MFLNAVHVMNDPQGGLFVPFPVSSEGLKSLNDCLGTWGDSLYLSAMTAGGFKFLSVPADRELKPQFNVTRECISNMRKLPNQVIEAGSQMLDNLTAQDSQVQPGGSLPNLMTR